MKTITQILREHFTRGLKVKDSFLAETIFRYSLFIVIVIFPWGCHYSEKEKFPSGELYGKIIYDTYIINRDSTDTWGDECLSKFKRAALIDKIFNDVFAGKITPYDYFTGEKIAIKQIKRMESEGEFSRKNISKIQFEERWIWDNDKIALQKQVISMTIAYEVYDNAGRSRGQKPIFKLVFSK